MIDGGGKCRAPMEVPSSGESHYYVTHEDFESIGMLSVGTPWPSAPVSI